ncbi:MULTISPECIES: winged helix-turn-helix domain-containing protein [Acinetobacter]|uniref:Winged helix-turn-helix transcriptional regulator n=1 Tax=Acinetobacter piscicola TaxID=2006115 RepID=A0A7S6VVE3_9GAMM|nr:MULTISPECIES: winged helix-turn-helix domain-containing protein [Acinetobacter]QOW45521.1 winged helix-turn-helix transcriptional regulator [Acinetobacter piscicola]
MSTYTEIFDMMIFTLSQFAQSGKALNTKEIQNLLDVSQRTAQRICKELNESGWLEYRKVGREKLYSASVKTKELFKVAL